jgi:hypothetical protein
MHPYGLPPAQIIALLRLHGGRIASALVKDMTESGFAPPSFEDICALAMLAHVTVRNGKVRLTPLGREMAVELIRKLRPHSSNAS